MSLDRAVTEDLEHTSPHQFGVECSGEPLCLGHHVVDRWTLSNGTPPPGRKSALGFQIGVDACQACRIVLNRGMPASNSEVIPAAAAAAASR